MSVAWILLALLCGLLPGYWLAHRRALATNKTAAGPDPAAALSASSDRLRAAVAAERDAIYADLHDDLVARLLDLYYSAESPAQAQRAQDAVDCLRGIVMRARRPPAQLLDLLAEIRAECERRLLAAGVELLWEQAALDDCELDQAQTLHLARVVREAVSNSLRHAAPHWLRVRVGPVPQTRALWLDITDDGQFARSATQGSGTTSMQARASEMGGSIAWNEGTAGGTKVALQIPLGDAAGAGERS